jgi:hypothetical protein
MMRMVEETVQLAGVSLWLRDTLARSEPRELGCDVALPDGGEHERDDDGDVDR